MLFTIDKKPVSSVWYARDFDNWRRRLGASDIKAIEEYLNMRIDEQLESGTERIVASSWLPGADWTGTPLQPIYEKACGSNAQTAALAYGLFLQSVFIDRVDEWVFVKMDPADGSGAGTFYFQPDW